MGKHTPGPWIVGNGKNIACTIYDKYGQRIANSFDGVMVTQRSDAQCEANARLIAAAPDMLEALQDCRRALEIANFTQELAVVDAAIAKATGDQQ